MTLKLNNPIWNTPQRRAVISKGVFEMATELGSDVRKVIAPRAGRGKVYRQGAITRVASKKNAVPGLRMTKGGRRVVGAKFIRRSKWGDPPVRDTGELYNSIAVERVSEFRARVRVKAPHGRFLEPPAKLNRPFLRSTFKKNKQKYLQKFRTKYRTLY